jgi:hypothetical protein
MRNPLALVALLAASASAQPGALAPDLASWTAALGAPGAETPVPDAAAFDQPAESPAPIPPPPTQTVVLDGLLDRHWTRADGFDDAAGRTAVSATLDLDKNGWLVVVPPGGAAILLQLARGMSGSWTAAGRTYSVDLLPDILARDSSTVRVKNDDGAVVWRRTITDLREDVDRAGRPVAIGGRSYRLFLSHLPAGPSPAGASTRVALVFVSDAGVGAERHQYFPYSADALAARPAYLTLLDGIGVYARLAPDLSALDISR